MQLKSIVAETDYLLIGDYKYDLPFDLLDGEYDLTQVRLTARDDNRAFVIINFEEDMELCEIGFPYLLGDVNYMNKETCESEIHPMTEINVLTLSK